MGMILSAGDSPLQDRKTDRLIFVMTDGLRWQEVFGGADGTLMNKEHGNVKDLDGLKQAYWRETPEARRATLMPFLWETIATRGQIFGNQSKGSEAHVTNGFNFSYPGYSETLCGFPDSRIKSNDKIPNPNVTVLEWLNYRPGFHGSVVAFAAWDVMPSILNAGRANFVINAGYDAFTSIPANPRLEVLNQLKAELPRVWDEEPFDPLPFHTAMEYLKARKPRVLFLSLGDTDDWAHDGNYSAYLDAAHRADAYLKTLWQWVQSTPEYRDRTTLVFTTDHGRGAGPGDWNEHGETIPASRYTWMAFLGPDTPALGERSNVLTVTSSQVAATLAAFLGEDYLAAVPKAGKPIRDVLPARTRLERDGFKGIP
jgi:hypothetical protein